MTSASRKTSSPTRNTDLAKIHIGATQLGMIKPGDDSAYRDMLWSVARTRSSATLTSDGRMKVLRHLRRCGWKSTHKKTSNTGSAQSRKVRSLWLSLRDLGALGDASEKSLRKWSSNQLNGDESDAVACPIELLNEGDLSVLIERLKGWVNRVEIGSDKNHETR